MMTTKDEQPVDATSSPAEDDLAYVRERVQMLQNAHLARRRLLQVSGAVSLSALLAACGNSASSPSAPTATANLAAPNPTAPPNVVAPTRAASSAPAPAGTTTAASAVSPTQAASSATTPQAANQTIGKLTVITDPQPKYTGTPLTADDVAFSMIAYRDDPDSGVARFFPLMKKDPVVVDANTVRFDLDDKSGDWILNACNQFILQKKQFGAYFDSGKGEKGAKTLKGFDYAGSNLIGTGAWKQTKYDPGAAPPNIQYEVNPNYFQGKPHYAKLVFKNIDQSSAQLTSWLNNETDMLWPVTANDIDQVSKQDGLVYSAYALAFMSAWINFQNPKSDTADFLKDKQVRQALSMGIDRKGYAQAIFKGFVDETRIGSIAFPWAYNTKLKNPDYDQTKAQSMLETAGYKKDGSGNLLDKNGKAVKFVAITSTSQSYPVAKIAVSMQEDFKKLGIAMDIQTLETAALKARWQTSLDYDLYFTSRILFAGFSDLNYYGSEWDVRKTKQGRNFGGWKNEQADTLLQQIIREPDLSKQKDLLGKFQEIIADDMPAFWFGFPRDLILVKKNIQGYIPNAMWQYWDTWKLWKTK